MKENEIKLLVRIDSEKGNVEVTKSERIHWREAPCSKCGTGIPFYWSNDGSPKVAFVNVPDGTGMLGVVKPTDEFVQELSKRNFVICPSCHYSVRVGL